MLFCTCETILKRLWMVVTFRYRATFISHVPNPVKSLFPRLGHYTPLSTFEEQANAGMTSESFDIEANIRDGDSRAGLDERGTQEVLEIMRRERVKCVLLTFTVFSRSWTAPMHSHSFDQARLIRQNQIFAANGIGPSGAFAAQWQSPRLTDPLSRFRSAAGCEGCYQPVTSL